MELVVTVRAVSRHEWKCHISRPGHPGLQLAGYPTKYTALKSALQQLSQYRDWPDVATLRVVFRPWEGTADE